MNFINIVHASNEEASATAEHTTEATADAGVFASLGINGQMLTFQFINFALVGVIVWFLILKPITKKMAERQKMIDDSIENSKKVEETLRRGERDYQTRIDTAKVEANKILEKTNVEAGKLSEELKVKAKQEIEGLVVTAKRNIQTEKDNMVKGLKDETANLIVSALEKILSEKIDEKKDKKIIEEMLEKVNSK